MLLVDGAHESCSGGQDLIDEDEDGFFRCKFDALANDINELANGQVLVCAGNVSEERSCGERSMALITAEQRQHSPMAPDTSSCQLLGCPFGLPFRR